MLLSLQLPTVRKKECRILRQCYPTGNENCDTPYKWLMGVCCKNLILDYTWHFTTFYLNLPHFATFYLILPHLCENILPHLTTFYLI
jgi:hypothetical protein